MKFELKICVVFLLKSYVACFMYRRDALLYLVRHCVCFMYRRDVAGVLSVRRGSGCQLTVRHPASGESRQTEAEHRKPNKAR